MCIVPGIDGTTSDKQCYQCHELGHIAPNCPNAASNSSNFIIQRMYFTQDGKATGIERS